MITIAKFPDAHGYIRWTRDLPDGRRVCGSAATREQARHQAGAECEWLWVGRVW